MLPESYARAKERHYNVLSRAWPDRRKRTMHRYLQTRGTYGSRILYDRELLDQCCEKFFDQHVLLGRSCVSAQKKGRGTVLVFEHGPLELVFKQYRRGGLLSRVIKDSYVFTGLEGTRMWREFRLLSELSALGLPVPRPVAARCEVTPGGTYRGALISERIPDARTLGEILAEQDLPEPTWSRVGELIARFHRHHVYHADRNVDNLLVDRSGEIYLIDFDKCGIWPHFRRFWARANLRRLQGSLLKFARRVPGFHYSDARWKALESGYVKG